MPAVHLPSRGGARAAGGELGPASSQVTGLISAAGQIQGAAAAALAWRSRPAVSSLADDVRREEAALAAGMASAAGPSGPREARGVSLPEVR